MKMIVPSGPELDLDLDWPAEVELVRISEQEQVPDEHRDAEACLLWGMSPNTYKFVEQLPNVKWFQSLAAGPDGLMNSNLGDDVLVTNGLNFHNKTVAEHTLALTLALARQIPACVRYQDKHVWSRLGGMQQLHPEDRVTTLLDENVLVWGFGAIGQEIGRVFAALGANVTGIAQSEGNRSGFPVYTDERLPELLPKTSVLVMVLPATEKTANSLTREVLEALPKRALVVNVGRGLTVDEDVLHQALVDGEIAGAAIDVVRKEPLAKDSPLWDTPNFLITPHAAGGRPYGLKERLEHNTRAYLEGRIGDMIGVIKQPR